MQVIGWDTETYPIQAGLAAPKGVCLTWCDGKNKGIVPMAEGLPWFRARLEARDTILVAHNAAYDWGIMAAEDHTLLPLIFRAVEEGRLTCTKIREKIIANASGELKFEWNDLNEKFTKSRFDLATLVKKRFYVSMSGKKKEEKEDAEDPWRKRYCELDNVPIVLWPKEAVDYALDDAVWALKLYFEQEKIAGVGSTIPGEVHVCKTALALGFLRIWGVRTDGDAVAELKAELTAEYVRWLSVAQDHGLVRRDAKCSRDMKAIYAHVTKVYTGFKLGVPLSESGKTVSTDRETLTFAKHDKLPRDQIVFGERCVDVGLKAVSEVVRLQKQLTTYIRILEKGTVTPITPDYNEMVETFRTSCAKPNVQNQGRGGGVRKCYIPRLGWIFAFCDYDTLEMRTLAQTCLDNPKIGFSFIAEAINKDRDLHLDLATEQLNVSYEEAELRHKAGDKVVEDVRQGCKIGNYGMAGGMGPDAFIDYSRGYGVEMTKPRAVQIHGLFRQRWKEMVPYFEHVSSLVGTAGEAQYVVHPRTGMIRGKVGYTALCNFYFQHLAAVGATAALYAAVKEMYVPGSMPDGSDSELYGCRAWLFNHDEIGMEIPYAAFGVERSHRAAKRLQAVMIEVMKIYTPGVKIGATVAMARRWYKGAKPIVVDGFLRPVKPIQVPVKDKPGEFKTNWIVDNDDSQGAAMPQRVAA